MDNKIVTSMRTGRGEIKPFPFTIDKSQRSTINPDLFILFMDILNEHTQVKVQWSMLFSTDIVLGDEPLEFQSRKMEKKL